MADDGEKRRERLARWYAVLRSRHVDIVGDYGGKELFLIHGDSLILHCIGSSRVDFEDGFQLLHAIFAVEAFLNNLKSRGCNFRVAFFDDHRELCVPDTAPKSRRYKYLLTRTILVQHLQRFMNQDENGDHFVLCFPSCGSPAFASWMVKNAILYLLCHDGNALHQSPSREQEMFLYMIHRFLCNEFSIGLIHTVDFQSSRVFATMITHGPVFRALPPSSTEGGNSQVGNNSIVVDYENVTYSGITLRERLIIAILSKLLQMNPSDDCVLASAALLIHTAIMRLANLSDRSLDIQSPSMSATAVKSANSFMELFCQEAMRALSSRMIVSQLHVTDWDLFDLFDGRLFLSMYSHVLEGRPLPHSVLNEAKRLATYVEEQSGVVLTEHKTFLTPMALSTNNLPSHTGFTQASVMSFNLAVLDEFLEPINLDVVDSSSSHDESRVFSELSHWHNARRLLDPKRVPQKPGFFASRKMQRFMRDILAYSASLTSATGKLIDPEVIVKPKQNSTLGVGTQHTGMNGEPVSSSGYMKGKKAHLSTNRGKMKAQEEARAIQRRKDEAKATTALANWKVRSQEFNNEPDAIKRYHKATKLLDSLKENTAGVKAEISLYICDIIYKAWAFSLDPSKNIQAMEMAGLLFNHGLETCKMAGLTREMSGALQAIGAALKISILAGDNHGLISRPLCFPLRIGYDVTPIKISGKPNDFQLQYCGPYLERSFDSQKDHRVPFDPDAWQRTVLDGIDNDKSLFIVAPTSSGKTFISFYAMKKILQADDDGVLVYVAPTKALVNQIAAEIQARFQKSYDRPARSVWAIHTRDTRTNNPTGCQVLVTVPHVLQIMLLSPSNSVGPNSWSHRVKRIIFDEVHCIGKADDGLIWEQLLLMAPCPIIALSATVGNPQEFYEWLKASQKSKGFDLEMIQHHSRYSDLRVFFHVPAKEFDFHGLTSFHGFPVPGLDRGGGSDSFRFIHPIAATINRVGFDLNEISLEPRDAFTLWTCMKKHQKEGFSVDSSLDPPVGGHSGILTKSDVLAWIQRLKATISDWMQDTKSPFQEIRAELGRLGLTRKANTQSEPNKIDQPSEDNEASKGSKPTRTMGTSVLPLLVDLRRDNGLPAILFNYDRIECERALRCVLSQLQSAETTWKESSKEWAQTMKKYELWRAGEKRKLAKDTRKLTKDERIQEEASIESSLWESFDPDGPHSNFSFADNSKLAKSEFQEIMKNFDDEHVDPVFIAALERGLGVHHAGMNRGYRQVVEMLFRKGFLTAVIATGTLALGINMPCKSVAFFGDSAYLTPLEYRQASGRAGRRGFDLLGNVVFSGDIRLRRAFELMSSRLPDLKGHFPLSTTLVLRILGLIDATTASSTTDGNSTYAVDLFKCLLAHNRLYLGGPEAKMAIRHHLRFSIEYLRRQHLLSATGKPLNFAGLIGHLYFTENAAFAFHSLLKGGYFHTLCSRIDKNRTETLRTLVLVMAHLFCHVSVESLRKYNPGVDIATSSLVLPRLPEDAERLLIQHNEETLQTFKSYAASYIEKAHLPPDRHLPLTGIAVGPEKPDLIDSILGNPGAHPPPILRSPFAGLSGRTDTFESIHDLCSGIRSGVFLEESVVPHMRVWPHDREATPLNAYLYNFFITGDFTALTRDNRIKKGDVWFLLKDFSLVLATVVASLTNFVGLDSAGGIGGGAGLDDVDILDMQEAPENPDDGAYYERSQESNIDKRPGTGDNTYGTTTAPVTPKKTSARKKKEVVLDSWEDDDGTISSGDDAEEDEMMSPESKNSFRYASSSLSSPPPFAPSMTDTETTASLPTWEGSGEGKSLVNVLRAFSYLKEEFNEKFKKTWA